MTSGTGRTGDGATGRAMGTSTEAGQGLRVAHETALAPEDRVVPGRAPAATTAAGEDGQECGGRAVLAAATGLSTCVSDQRALQESLDEGGLVRAGRGPLLI